MSIRTFKYRLYPNKEQTEKLDWTLARCCELYNAALQERRDTWNIIKASPNYYDLQWRKEAAKEHGVSRYGQSHELTEIKHEVRPEYQQIHDHILRDVLARVDLAFDKFFKRVKSGAKKAGYPRYRSKNRYDSFTYPDLSGWKVDHGKLILSKIGEVKIKLHRAMEGTPKICTVKREGTHWYVCIACEVAVEHLPVSYEDVGIDLGITHFAALSDEIFIDNPRYYRKSEKKLKKAQEALSRKKRRSNRRKKAVQRVARCHRKVRNQRNDYLHKESRKLVNRYQVIAFEDLQTDNLLKRPKPKQDENGTYLPNGASAKAGLNKSINDAGWAMFTKMTTCKAEWAGRTVVKVNPSKTSQICSACHLEGPHKDLSERTHTCVHCGVVLDRDTNAAINILARGQKLLREA